MRTEEIDLSNAETRAFIEDFAYNWASIGNSRMDGRVLGLLLITDEPYLSLSQISSLLGASTGAISTATRALASLGFIRPHAIPGDRNHYFRADDDVWGSFLAGERDGLRRLADSIETGLRTLPEGSSGPRTRLNNARHYMNWITSYHHKMLADWADYRDAHRDDTDGDDR